MGGKGSGNYFHTKTRTTTNDCLELDMRKFKKRNWLSSSNWQTLTWTKGGREIGSIQYRYINNQLNLNYRSRKAGGDWLVKNEVISLIKTPCNFGGFRQWFRCNQCNNKVVCLYATDIFKCRKCANLIHPSANESKLDRASRALGRYQRKLAPDSDIGVLDGVTWLSKPKWMRYKNYFKIKREATAKQNQFVDMMIESFGVSYL